MKDLGAFSNFQENESRRQKERRTLLKSTQSSSNINKDNVQKKKIEAKLYMRQYRENIRNKESKSSVQYEGFLNRASFGKAFAKARRNLPADPVKCQKVIQHLAKEICPSILRKCAFETPGTSVISTLNQTVVDFYSKDSISYQARGLNDFIIVRDKGLKTKIQKRYLCMTLGEAYQNFKELNPDIQIGRSKFCELRPLNIKLRSETSHNTRLCIYHENVRLILESLFFLPNHCTEFLKMIVCYVGAESCCYSQTYSECGNLKKFEALVANVDDTMLDNKISYASWINDETAKLTRKKISAPIFEVVDILRQKLILKFVKHNYIHYKQSQFFETLKTSLPDDTCNLHFDFSENYSFDFQDEV